MLEPLKQPFRVKVPFPTALVVAPITSVAVIGACLLLYIRKVKNKNK